MAPLTMSAKGPNGSVVGLSEVMIGWIPGVPAVTVTVAVPEMAELVALVAVILVVPAVTGAVNTPEGVMVPLEAVHLVAPVRLMSWAVNI